MPRVLGPALGCRPPCFLGYRGGGFFLQSPQLKPDFGGAGGGEGGVQPLAAGRGAGKDRAHDREDSTQGYRCPSEGLGAPPTPPKTPNPARSWEGSSRGREAGGGGHGARRSPSSGVGAHHPHTHLQHPKVTPLVGGCGVWVGWGNPPGPPSKAGGLLRVSLPPPRGKGLCSVPRCCHPPAPAALCTGGLALPARTEPTADSEPLFPSTEEAGRAGTPPLPQG